MKPWHENDGATIYVGRATTVHNPLFTLQNRSYWSVAPTHFKIHCCLCMVKAKNANKNIYM